MGDRIDPGQPDNVSGQLVPGVRYRAETRTRYVPHTIDGQTEVIEETHTVHVPIPPRDWDRMVLSAVTGAAVLLVSASVVWSTASIGDLFHRVTVAPVAYFAAVVFDVAWITCLALEWLARYNPDRAVGPRRAGRFALALAMAAVCAHGWLDDSVWVGLAGAAVSALAKGMYSTVLKAHARPLDARTQAWLAKREGDLGARLALSARMRHLTRIEGQHAALLAATAPSVSAESGRGPDLSGQESGPDNRKSGTVRSAVRAAAAALSEPTPEAIAAHLGAIGIETDAATVADVLEEEPAPDDAPSVRPLRAGGKTVTETVRIALASGITERGRVIDYALRMHPGAERDNVRRICDRELAKQAG